MPPPLLAWPSVTRVLKSSSEPALRMLPPSSLPARPPVIVTPMMLTVTPAATLITRVDPLPWMIVSCAFAAKEVERLGDRQLALAERVRPAREPDRVARAGRSTAARSVVHANAAGNPGYGPHEPAPSAGSGDDVQTCPSARADSTATSAAATTTSTARRARSFMAPPLTPG